ncbi:MAG: glycosyltransferase [Sorangiineae bacterium]|nr:glycosyltransferase [Polyangiaceae bacterium]MEB2324580.1 glycosyltransferase [Sorangiineae bacterium]
MADGGRAWGTDVPPRGTHPALSVLTATTLSPERLGFLLELHADLDRARCDWEWVLAVDGDHARALPAALLDDPRVRSLRVGRRVGAAAARNLALGLARGDFVTSADDDDRLPPGSLARRLAAAREHHLGWVAGRIADLDERGAVPFVGPVSSGLNQPGDVWRAWACPCFRFPIGPTTLLVEAGLLRRVGGWQGLPQAEDLGMVLSVTGQVSGFVLDEVVYLYRKHAAQMTVQPEFDALEPLVRHITFERGRLVAAARAQPGSHTTTGMTRSVHD